MCIAVYNGAVLKIFNTVTISLFPHYKKLFYKGYTFTNSIIIDKFRSLQ